MVDSRVDLTSLLTAMACDCVADCRSAMIEFLSGLSTTELQYIADFISWSTMGGSDPFGLSRQELRRAISDFEGDVSPSGDGQAHRMLVVLEYYCRISIRSKAAAAHSGL